MKLYKGNLELLDYLFFATVERGKVYETGRFVHNYALTYALGLIQSDSYTYSHVQQLPQYQAELTPLNNVLYLTPAIPNRIIANRLIQWNTLPESYAFPGKPPSIGYPDWGFSRVLCPHNNFTFYLLIHDTERLPQSATLDNLLAGQPVRIRLGKFNGKAKITLHQADEVKEKEGTFHSEALLNWRDLAIDPMVCDVVPSTLPTRLIKHSHFDDGAYYEATFGEESVRVPQAMQYLARPLETKTKGKRKK